MANLQDQPPPSCGSSIHESVMSDSSFTTSNPDLARVFIRLADGRKIVVPVPQDASVDELHRRALLRAARLGIDATIDSTFLETTGSNNVVVFGEDALIDIMDLTDDNTFCMKSSENTATSNLSIERDIQTSGLGQQLFTFRATPPSFPKEAQVYVRWITLEAAMNTSRLRKIPVDAVPFPMHTTLNDLHKFAVERLCDGSQKGACTNATSANLFLRECVLHTENNLATLRDLGLVGGNQEPLDIFVEFTGPRQPLLHPPALMATGPGVTWSFDTTKRGMSTFITSVQILLHEIAEQRCSLEGILEVLLELTHFPPLLLAFKSLYETGIGTGISVQPLLLVASAFYAICGKMVPSKICHSSANWLEASRQVMCWIYSVRSEASLSRASSMQLIYRAHVTESKGNSQSAPYFLPFHATDVSMTAESGPDRRSFLVSIETKDTALCELLGIALNKKSSLPWEFYFQAGGKWESLWNHRLIPTLNSNEFKDLVESTNLMGAFRMVGPLQLGSCLAAELPVITLSATGYVSKYEHEDLECSERSFLTWNAIEGRIKLPENPGQFLSQKLDPILLEQKKSPAWELDAWPEWTKSADFGVPDEAIVICVDTSSSMKCTMPDEWLPGRSTVGTNPSRLTEVKEFFKNLALRISAMNLSTHLGLVTFSNKTRVNVRQPLSPLHLNFNHQLDNITAEGSTAIFDAIYNACAMLCDLKEKHPATRCRIILLTDGEDNNSGVLPQTASQLLYKNNIVLDAVVIGSNVTSDLFKIAAHTGGYAFLPKTQQALFQIFLLETVVDIKTRPDLIRLPCIDWNRLAPKQPDMEDAYDFPPCRSHPNLSDYFVALAEAERFMNRLSRKAARSSASTLSSSTRLSTASTMNSFAGGISRILLSEIKAMIDNPHVCLDVYVSQSNMGFWKVVMKGPPESAYKDGTFLLYIEVGEEFPRKPPSARFVTPILHPNITKHGRVCHPIFDREWSPSTRVYQVLQQLYGILMSLEARDAIDPLSALRFWSDEQEGRREVQRYVYRFARRSREQHRADIISHDLSSIASSSSVVSTTASTSSASTIISPSPNHLSAFQSRGQVQNPFSGPPSYRSGPSVAGSISSTSTRSTYVSPNTLLGHLNTPRRPQRPEEGLVVEESRLVRTFGSTDGRSMDGTPVSGIAGAMVAGKRVSRRASFFGRLMEKGSGSGH